MAINLPSRRDLRALAADLGMALSESDVSSYLRYFADAVAAYDALDRIPDNLPPVKYPRTPGHRPEDKDNPYNAWIVKTTIRGKRTGKLAGKTAAIKDSICVAGVPLKNGANVMEGYVPEVDATVVTRILDAGGTVLGKSECEYFCYSSGSHTGASGTVDNPIKPGHSAGGSSSGSAALVAGGEVDLALGTDVSGSIRIPAAHCGIYGMYPTFGLVPYTGVVPYEFTADNIGPLTASVADNALLLEVIAGFDGIDPRQSTIRPKVARYTQALGQGVKGLRLGLVKEGFEQPTSMPEVNATVRAAAKRFAKLGVVVEEVSIPWHIDAMLIESVYETEGFYMNMVGNGLGTNHGGLYLNSLGDKIAGWRERADEFPANVKLALLLGAYANRQHHGRYYGKAQNLIRKVTAAFDAALSRYDLLAMPTCLALPRPNPPLDAPPEVVIAHAFENVENTSTTNHTHHPSFSIPCGMIDGCPVGIMLIAKHYDESTIYRAAHAFEQAVDWRKISAQPGKRAR